MGEMDLALEAAVVAFQAEPEASSYQQVRELAGEGWPGCRAELLDHLRHGVSYYPLSYIEVFLHEGLVEDAIAATEKSPVPATLARVADAAIHSHPDWVIETCSGQAEEIMDSKKAKHYEQAVR